MCYIHYFHFKVYSWFFGEFPDLIEYSTTSGTSTLLKEEHTTSENHNPTILKDIDNLMYLAQPNFSEDTPNQILHILNTIILWSKTFYTTIAQYPTLYDFVAITQDELILWEYHLDNPNTCVNTTTTTVLK